MAAVTVNPFVWRDVVINLKDGATDLGDFQASIPKLVATPNTPVVVERGSTPTAVFADVGSTDWTVDMDFFQDWATANASGLSQYTFANSGKVVTLAVTPKPGAGIKKFTVNILIVPTVFGAEQGTMAKASATFQGVGPATLA